MIRILVVDDHAVVRQGLLQILREVTPGAEFGEADSARAALAAVARESWSVVILDVSLPDANGLELLEKVRKISPRTPVLLLSMHPEEHLGIAALRAGAAGYVSKKSAARQIGTAVRRALSGRRYVSDSLAELLAGRVGGSAERPPHERLSRREYEVFGLLARGHTVKEIAGRLGVTVQTVSTHRSRLLEKTGLSGNAEIVQYGIRYRLFD